MNCAAGASETSERSVLPVADLTDPPVAAGSCCGESPSGTWSCGASWPPPTARTGPERAGPFLFSLLVPQVQEGM